MSIHRIFTIPRFPCLTTGTAYSVGVVWVASAVFQRTCLNIRRFFRVRNRSFQSLHIRYNRSFRARARTYVCRQAHSAHRMNRACVRTRRGACVRGGDSSLCAGRVVRVCAGRQVGAGAGARARAITGIGERPLLRVNARYCGLACARARLCVCAPVCARAYARVRAGMCACACPRGCETPVCGNSVCKTLARPQKNYPSE